MAACSARTRTSPSANSSAPGSTRQNELLIEREQELNVRNEQLDAALNNMLQGLAMYDSQFRLVMCNRRYAEMYGLSPEQVKRGTPLREIMEHRIARG